MVWRLLRSTAGAREQDAISDSDGEKSWLYEPFQLLTARVAKNTVGSVIKLGTLWPRVSTPKAYNCF